MGEHEPRPASAVVLAGGLSRRLGQDKRRLRLWGDSGPTLLEHTLAIAVALCPDLVVVLNDPEAWPGLPGRLVPDRYPDGGALGAIFSGLAAAAEPYALVLACDLPLLSPPLLAAMLARPRDYDVLAPRALVPGDTRNSYGLEPLHAIYGRACLEPISAALAAGRRQVAGFFPQVRLAILEPHETLAHDPSGRALLNVNTPAQLAEALRGVRREIPP